MWPIRDSDVVTVKDLKNCFEQLQVIRYDHNYDQDRDEADGQAAHQVNHKVYRITPGCGEKSKWIKRVWKVIWWANHQLLPNKAMLSTQIPAFATWHPEPIFFNICSSIIFTYAPYYSNLLLLKPLIYQVIFREQRLHWHSMVSLCKNPAFSGMRHLSWNQISIGCFCQFVR